MTVLSVEDNEDSIYMLKNGLTRNGFHVFIAIDGVQVLPGDRDETLTTRCNDGDAKPVEIDPLIAKIDGLAGYRGGVQSLRTTRRTIGSKVAMGSLA